MDLETSSTPSNSDAEAQETSNTNAMSDSESSSGTDSNNRINKQKKRSLSNSTTLVVSQKKARMEVTSSIRSALDSKEPCGIILYFKKATDEEHHQFLARTSDEIKERMNGDEWNANRMKEREKFIRQEREKIKKREQRERRKMHEISKGLRSPGGTKQRVCVLFYR
jgi:hypothetical protein